FAGKKSAQIREILISESAWEEMTCLFALSLGLTSCSIQPGKNFKDHFIRHKGILEGYLGKKYPKWKVDEGAEFLRDVEKLRDSGKLVHVGQGTIKKGQPVMEIYRGEGMTYISKKLSDGREEFVTLIESGKGMDLGIVFSP
ncbi:hypothetical protein V6E14_24300, partial [Serratia marcescens]